MRVLFLLATGVLAAQPLPQSFPAGDYTPFGYIDNPYHTAVLHRSGIVRSVPPLGFGYWARGVPWPYGTGTKRDVNYLSLAHLSVVVDGVAFHEEGDFAANGIQLVSRYHTKNVMSYDWTFHGVTFSARWFLPYENTLACLLEMRNAGAAPKAVTVFATDIYGFPEESWWGSDGVAARYRPDVDAGVAKIWAYGDVFVIGADRKSAAHRSTAARDEWERLIRANDLTSNDGSSVEFPKNLYVTQAYRIELPAGRSESMLLTLNRGVNEDETVAQFRRGMSTARQVVSRQLEEDDRFYRNAPLLTGDWSPAWKRGWIYDFETLRGTIRPPIGIYKHPWDGMQVDTPRVVLAETLIDTATLSYADPALAKNVILGTFADAPMPNVPCTREDGSMNMICADGSEVGTAPDWSYPLLLIRWIYGRDHDEAWLRSLYPHMKSYLDWWLANRTDKDGWFHALCSWESGQDASKRFLVAEENAGAVAAFVRTVDIEASMADAMRGMAALAPPAGRPGDVALWTKLAGLRVDRTRSMFVNGWFRDFDARTGKPIVLKDYFDIMMLAPLALDIATPEQMKQVRPMFDYFREHAPEWLIWPNFVLTYSEAAWYAGVPLMGAQAIADVAARVYARTDARHTTPAGKSSRPLPEPYNYRVPGIADEYWPFGDTLPGGENYGWGASLPLLIIRTIVGFRETADPAANEFILAPAIPATLAQPGRQYGITNLHFRGSTSNLNYAVGSNGALDVTLECRPGPFRALAVRDAAGKVIARAAGTGALKAAFRAANAEAYNVRFE